MLKLMIDGMITYHVKQSTCHTDLTHQSYLYLPSPEMPIFREYCRQGFHPPCCVLNEYVRPVIRGDRKYRFM